MMLMKIIMRIYACTNCNNIKFPLYVLKVLKLCLFSLPMLDDYCDDLYAIKNNDTMKLVIMILLFNWIMPHMIVIFVEFSPTTIHEKKFAYVEM